MKNMLKSAEKNNKISVIRVIRDSLYFFLCFLCFFAANPVFGYSGGTGEPNNPYQIADVNNLLQLAGDPNDYNKCFIMTADINLAGYNFNNSVIAPVDPYNPPDPYIPFSGIFDGNEHKISNLTIDSNQSSNTLGLFNSIEYAGGASPVVKNLGLENIKITGIGYGGGALAAVNLGSTEIINCYATVDINLDNGGYVGGLIGLCSGGSSIINCHTHGKMDLRFLYPYTEHPGIGGLVGLFGENTHIEYCYSNVDITANAPDYFVGGLAGAGTGQITKCFSTGNIAGGYYTGGLCGSTGLCSLNQCFATGNVTGLLAGGLVGINGYSIENCYSTGNVNGESSIGGLVGDSYGPYVINCYSTGIVTDGTPIGGLVGYGYVPSILNSYFLETSGPNNGCGEPLTDSQMKHRANFNNWDFVNGPANRPDANWTIIEDVNYPWLVWPKVNLLSPKFPFSWYEVDFADFAAMGNQWKTGNGTADIDFSGDVDLFDLKIFCNHWLDGAMP